MAILSTRAEFEAAQKATDKQLRALFEQMTAELSGIVSQAANGDGVVPPAQADAVRQKARQAVARYFVQDRPINGQERTKELERLHTLVKDAQRAMRGASERTKVQLRGRVSLLSRRIAQVQAGTTPTAFDSDGRGVTLYARALRDGVLSAIREVVSKHTADVRKRIQEAKAK